MFIKNKPTTVDRSTPELLTVFFYKKNKPSAGVEPAIFWLEVRRLIHLATKALRTKINNVKIITIEIVTFS